MKKAYTMNGNKYTNLTAIAKELGLSRVRPSQFAKYGITEVNVDTPAADAAAVPAMAPTQDNTAADTTPTQDDSTPIPTDNDQAGDQTDNTNTGDSQDKDEPDQKDEPKPKKGSKPKADKAEKQPKEPTLADTIKTAGEISEDISKTVSLEDFSKALRKIPLDVLKACADKANVEAPWQGSEPIQRMHLTLNLREHFYPGQKLEAKKASPFRKIPLDVLTAKADELGLSYHTGGGDAITRMWATKALTDAGVNAEDLMPQPDTTPAPADAADQGDDTDAD